MIYLDSAATTLQKPPAVAAAVTRAMATMASPGRGGHRPAMEAAQTAFNCRKAAAELFHVEDPERVVFTFNATHGLNIAIKTLVKPGDTVVVSGWEHNAVTRPLAAMEGVTIRVAAAPLFDQEATLSAFRRAITPEVRAVICIHVSNVFGFILPVEEIARLCRSRGVPFIVDASQSAGCLPLDFGRLEADFMAMPGHKGLLGPQGTGLLLCGREGAPLLEGGTGSNSKSQEMPSFLPDRLEAGTHNVPGLAGLLEGIRYVQKQGVERIHAHEEALIRMAGAGLAVLPGVKVFLSPEPASQASVLSFLVAGKDCETLGAALAAKDLALRTGLHCAPYAHHSAGTLETGTLRLSVSPFNTAKEIQRFLQITEKVLASQ